MSSPESWQDETDSPPQAAPDAHRRPAAFPDMAQLDQVRRIAGMGFLDWDLSTGELFVSPEVFAVSGLEDTGGVLSVEDIFARLHPDDRDAVRQSLETAVAGKGDHNLQHRFVHDDGSVIWVHAIASLGDPEFGEAPHLLGSVVDITEQKLLEQERRELQVQLQTQRRLESIGALAGGIAHDFNNLLTVINSYTDLVIEQLRDDDPRRADLQEVRAAGERATHLTQQLLAFSRAQPSQPVALDLGTSVDDLSSLLQRLVPENIELQITIAENLGATLIDPVQVEQLLMNLVVNAVDAMPDGGRLSIRADNVDLDADYRRQHAGVSAGPYVHLCVRDTGSGIDDATLQHVFDPFFSTKPRSKGTGLGLSTVYGIVKQNRGHIQVDSRPGQGAAFEIFLPRVPPQAADSIADDAAEPAATGNENLLVVEDEVAVRTLLERVLAGAGYRVVTAANGREALRILELGASRFDLVLTDRVMPQMGGVELAAEVRNRYPELPILLVSGYVEREEAGAGAVAIDLPLLAKPFSTDELLRVTRDMLDRARAALG